MTRTEAISQLQEQFGECRTRSLEGGDVLAVVGPISINGGAQRTKVAVRLPDPISVRPEVFVETHVTLNNGGQPNDASNIDVDGEPWKRWSFQTPWNPENYTMGSLVYAVLHVFNR